MKRYIAAVGLFTLALAAPAGPALAAPFTDSLSRCLVESSTEGDKSDLVLWMFAALGQHPKVMQYVDMTAAQRAAIDGRMAATVDRLLTVACRKETVAALKYEGAGSLEVAFGVFGKSAANSLMSDPAVGAAMGQFADKMDAAALKTVFSEAGLPTD